jgi:energy-coupling factor transporter transmembrane protein EcfT
MGKFSGNSNTTEATADEGLNGNGSKPKERNDFYDIIGRIVDMGVKVVGLIIYVPARILDNFVDHNKPGIKVLAAALFMVGTVMSSDSFFQSFGGKPLFPFWEDSWIGIGWLWVWTKVNFWAAVVVALAAMWIESKAIRGKDLGEAKRDYESIKHHTVPEKNPKSVDLVEAKRQDYKRAGMGERSILGAFILTVVVADILATFVMSRNPWGQPPLTFIAMSLYNFVSLVAGEAGYVLWHQTDRKY